MDTMEPGNLKDGYWTIYFITMTMAVCKPIYYKPTEQSFVSESMSIIMPIVLFSCVISNFYVKLFQLNVLMLGFRSIN